MSLGHKQQHAHASSKMAQLSRSCSANIVQGACGVKHRLRLWCRPSCSSPKHMPVRNVTTCVYMNMHLQVNNHMLIVTNSKGAVRVALTLGNHWWGVF
eukprot:2080946-Amphidinium_carterae.1